MRGVVVATSCSQSPNGPAEGCGDGMRRGSAQGIAAAFVEASVRQEVRVARELCGPSRKDSVSADRGGETG